ncbi:uncharacterized protein LOC111915502 [Lactuca sativa]|uniref:uncharacterized protein LOC111915502 n=1 Tax=Lactuca sativa TaxID=4236 RepID=UPI001C68DDFB|nr:uncharacterized protein LOC111915502 [Lactuca sativa]
MAELLSNLQKVKIEYCDGIEEVVSKKDDEDEEMTTSTSTHTSTPLFPHLDSLILNQLKNLKCIGGGGAKDESNEISFNNTTTTTTFHDQFKATAGGVSWSLCQYSREIGIVGCHALSSVIPCYAAAGQMQKFQVLRVVVCDGMKEVFETQLGTRNNKNNRSGCDEAIPRVNNNVIMLPNVKLLKIEWCGRLEHISTFSALESLRQLEELKIKDCEAMKVIVKKEEEDASSSSSSKKVVVVPRLKSIELVNLRELEGFFFGMNEFEFPSLDNVTIMNCPQMRVFAPGGSTSPNLKCIYLFNWHHLIKKDIMPMHIRYLVKCTFFCDNGALTGFM